MTVSDDSVLAEALADWFAAARPSVGDVVVSDVRRPSGSGFSADTVFCTATWTEAGVRSAHPLVLRRESPDPAMYPQQVPGFDVEIEFQYRVMSALRGSGADIPLADLLGYDADPRPLGTPFFLMEYVAGQVPVENPPYPVEGFFHDAAPEQRAAMVGDGLRVLAALHALDWRAAGLEWLVTKAETPSPITQFHIWEECADKELRGREHPVLDRARAWLRERLPAASVACAPDAFSWGDARPGNMIWRDFRCVCVTDFEAAAIAAPELDLGWWLMFDRASHEAIGVPRLPGEPTREEQRAAYAAHAGRDIGDTHVWEVLAAMRYTVIVVRAMNRAEDRGLMPPGRTIWRDNPASVCLAQLLDAKR